MKVSKSHQSKFFQPYVASPPNLLSHLFFYLSQYSTWSSFDIISHIWSLLFTLSPILHLHSNKGNVLYYIKMLHYEAQYFSFVWIVKENFNIWKKIHIIIQNCGFLFVHFFNSGSDFFSISLPTICCQVKMSKDSLTFENYNSSYNSNLELKDTI